MANPERLLALHYIALAISVRNQTAIWIALEFLIRPELWRRRLQH